MRKFNFSSDFLHIVCGLLATQHARCHKEYYSPREQTVSTSHFGVRGQRPFCVSKAILHFWRSSTPQKSHFFVKCHHLTCHGCNHAKPWSRSNFFYILWIELRFCMRKAITSVAGGKIFLAKTNWFFHEKSSTFQKFRLHCSHLSCHSTCP